MIQVAKMLELLPDTNQFYFLLGLMGEFFNQGAILCGFGSLYLWPHKEYSCLRVYKWSSLKVILYNYEKWLGHDGSKQIANVVNYYGQMNRKHSCSSISKIPFSGPIITTNVYCVYYTIYTLCEYNNVCIVNYVPDSVLNFPPTVYMYTTCIISLILHPNWYC